jgi:hypothetical protein
MLEDHLSPWFVSKENRELVESDAADGHRPSPE